MPIYWRESNGELCCESKVEGGQDIVTDSTHHYPYVCHLSHCVEATLCCRNKLCEDLLQVRLESLGATDGDAIEIEYHNKLHTMENEVTAIKAKIGPRWCTLFMQQQGPVFNGSVSVGNLLCKSDCISCLVELRRRQKAFYATAEAIHRKHLQEVKEYYRLWQADMESQNAYKEKQQNKIRDAENFARKDESDIRELETSAQGLAGFEEYEASANADVVLAVQPECDCAACGVDAELENHGSLRKRAKRMKRKLRKLLVPWQVASQHSYSSPSTNYDACEYESWPEEDYDISYGRTGSYRDHGAGAMKPRGPGTNSNASMNEEGDSENRNGKKGKKPGLTGYRY